MMLWKKVVLWHFHVIKLKMIWHCVLASQKASCTPGFIKQAWPTCWGRWSSPSAPLLWAQTYSIVFSSWVSSVRSMWTYKSRSRGGCEDAQRAGAPFLLWEAERVEILQKQIKLVRDVVSRIIVLIYIT